MKKIKALRLDEKLDECLEQLILTMFDDTTAKDVDRTIQKYADQMPSFITGADEEQPLKYVL